MIEVNWWLLAMKLRIQILVSDSIAVGGRYVLEGNYETKGSSESQQMEDGYLLRTFVVIAVF